MISKIDLTKSFNSKAEQLSQYQMAFESLISDLRPNQIRRSFITVMRYPVPMDAGITADSKEQDLISLGNAISELKTEMATLSAALSQLGD